MSRGLPTAALAALVLWSFVVGCGPSAPPTTGKAGPLQTSGAGPASTARPAETVKETAKSSSHHDPG